MSSGRFSVETVGEARLPTPLERASEVSFTDDRERIVLNPHLSALAPFIKKSETPESFELAGPRPKIFFDPKATRAAIVTCGGLCPGINAVIRGIVMQLWYRYGCRDILGVRYGYGGLGKGAEVPRALDPDIVSDIHSDGGTILGSSRGAPTASEIVDSIERLKIRLLFPIGGDGTMRGAEAIYQEAKRRNLKLAIVCVPKTIDNDIAFVRRTFGFETAVGAATESVRAAHVEATGVPYGIGLVKIMGRHAGYIAANATVASGHANICLVPEVPFGLEGEGGLLDVLEKRVRARRHAVIVAAEGAGQYFFDQREPKRDASGNVKLGDIGLFLKERITAHFAGRGFPLTLKYIDPSYLIRTAPANPADQLHCARLAQNAVHAALAGKTGIMIGYWHGQMTHVPTRVLTGMSQRINPRGELWLNLLEMTGQPATIGTPPATET